MALTTEWRRRIDNWRNEMANHFYRELGTVSLSGFTTREQLTAPRALDRNFHPMPPGTEWGAKWEYGWFKGEIVLPQEAAGQRIVLKAEIGKPSSIYGGVESAIFVDGKLTGAKDGEHHHVTLCLDGVPGTRYEVLAEGYAGHGARCVHAGPIPPDREAVPEPGPTQAVVGESTFGIWQEEVYQLWLDVETLYQLRDNIAQNSLRVAEIDAALRDFTVIVDLELPQDEMLATVRACRERLKPLLACVNGSTAPTLFAFGHAHLDVAWLWPLAETERKAARTLATQLALMDEYPEYRFLQSQPHLYRMVQKHYPELYARVKEAAARGQLVPEGSTWVEPDTNIPSGESLIRQFIHGKRFFREEFGVECETLWLPDVFGYSGALPQIMRGCGVKYFSSAKIFWAYNNPDPFPYNTFTWEGIDGSEIAVHLCNSYSERTDPGAVIRCWNTRVQKDGYATRPLPFGWGDGGGGPTRNHIEHLRRLKDLEGAPRVKIAPLAEYFQDLEARGMPEARYVGELYFQAHRGTYTSQARTKRGNRKSEVALREAEMWGAAAQVLKGFEFPSAKMDEAWKLILLNQFHDILPGSSIQRVYEEAEANYATAINAAQSVVNRATSALTDDTQTLTVFNSLSWKRTALVALPEDFEGAADESGKALPIQFFAGKAWTEATIPSCGWTTLHPAREVQTENMLKATEKSLENELLRVEFNDRGEISSILDKETGRELAAGPCNSLKMYKDVPTAWDAWDLDSMYELTPVELEDPASFEIVTGGPIVAILRVARTLHNSTMTQEITLRRNSRRLDFRTVIDWQERHKLLKVNFPVSIHANEGVHEIQFGHIRRPNHKSRSFDADRFEVPNQKWTALMEENRGCAVLNDCKYGVNVSGNSINLTLLKSALAPDMTADRGRQEFTCAFYTWNGSFAESPLVREAYELNCPVTPVPGAAGIGSLFSMDALNVIADTVKPAEDGSGDVVVRLYESKRMATHCTLSTSLPVIEATQTNMLETGEKALLHRNGELPLAFRPFEIKTVRLRLSG